VPVAGSTGLTGATLLTGAINAQNVEVEGIDYEISYRTNLSTISDKLPGSLNLRVLASQRLADRTALPGDTTPPDLGTPTSLKWRGFASATYSVGPSRTTVTARYLGPGVVSNLRPTERNGIDPAFNDIPAVWYWELAQNVDVKVGGRTVTLFAVVENLFDKDPPPVPSNGTSFGVSPVYDLLGRSYRVGLRFKM
jgi:outer membrane receptor protein involved in Fe transport